MDVHGHRKRAEPLAQRFLGTFACTGPGACTGAGTVERLVDSIDRASLISVLATLGHRRSGQQVHRQLLEERRPRHFVAGDDDLTEPVVVLADLAALEGVVRGRHHQTGADDFDPHARVDDTLAGPARELADRLTDAAETEIPAGVRHALRHSRLSLRVVAPLKRAPKQIA